MKVSLLALSPASPCDSPSESKSTTLSPASSCDNPSESKSIGSEPC